MAARNGGLGPASDRLSEGELAEEQTTDVPQQDAGEQAWIRWRRVGLVVVAVVVLATILYLARGALFPFIISIVLAELLYPVVVFLEKRLPGHDRKPGATRVVAILAIYVASVALVAGVLFLTIPPLFAEAEELVETFPELYERSRSTVEGWSDEFTERIPVELRTQLEEAVAAGGNVLADAARGVVQRTVSGVSNAVTIVIGLAVVPFFLFYILKDREEVVGGVYPLLSRRAQKHVHSVIVMVNNVIGSYVRAQLLSATVVGVLVFIGLSILGIKFAAILGLLAGLFGLVPIIGPLLGAVPGLLVTLASSPSQVIWVALVYVIVQLLENNLISPRIQSSAVRLNPAIIVAILVVSSEVAGLWGVIIGVPLVAASRDVFVYFYKEWDTGDGDAALAAGDEGEPMSSLPESNSMPDGQPEELA